MNTILSQFFACFMLEAFGSPLFTRTLFSGSIISRQLQGYDVPMPSNPTLTKRIAKVCWSWQARHDLSAAIMHYVREFEDYQGMTPMQYMAQQRAQHVPAYMPYHAWRTAMLADYAPHGKHYRKLPVPLRGFHYKGVPSKGRFHGKPRLLYTRTTQPEMVYWYTRTLIFDEAKANRIVDNAEEINGAVFGKAVSFGREFDIDAPVFASCKTWVEEEDEYEVARKPRRVFKGDKGDRNYWHKNDRARYHRIADKRAWQVEAQAELDDEAEGALDRPMFPPDGPAYNPFDSGDYDSQAEYEQINGHPWYPPLSWQEYYEYYRYCFRNSMKDAFRAAMKPYIVKPFDVNEYLHACLD